MVPLIEFIKTHWRKIFLFALFAIGLLLALRALGEKSIIIGNPDNIVVISPEQSQDVIVIGDPDNIKVKPKSK